MTCTLKPILMLLLCGLLLPLQAQPKRPQPQAPAQSGPAGERNEAERGAMRLRMLLENLKNTDPQEYNRLSKLQRENREKFFEELKKKFPPRDNAKRHRIMEIERECWQLAGKIRQATPEARDALQEQLKKLIAESLELVIADTRERLQRVQGQLQDLEQKKNDISRQRLELYLSTPAAEQPAPAEHP